MPQTTTSDERTGAALPRWLWLSFGILTIATYFVGLNLSLVGPDEPRYAQVAREMTERGDWITPTLGGHVWFEKPALLYWLEIVSYKIFGVSEFAARLGPALFGIGTIAALFLIGRSLYGSRGCGIGGYFALIAASTTGLIVFAHGTTSDIIVTFPITAALACFWKYDEGGRPGESRVAWLIGFYAFIGIALLGKGLIGIVLPIGIVGGYYVLSWRRPSAAVLLSLLWGTLLAALIASIWYVPMYIRHGWQFIDEFIIQHHFARFVSDKYQHSQPLYFYLWVLPLLTLPWLPFFIAGSWRAIKVGARRHSDASSPLLLFALSWILVPLVFFTASDSKLPGYILPAVSGAIVLAALMCHELASKSRAWRNVVVSIAGVTLLGTVIGALTLAPRYADADSVRPLMQVATSRGYGDATVLMYRTISHNAEFYAAGRLDRDTDGQLIRHNNINEIASYLIENSQRPILVLMPRRHAEQLTASPLLTANLLADNGDLAIVAVALK